MTDPPFGDNFIYSELANFFYAWLRLPLCRWYPDVFRGTSSPFAQEAVKNVAHHESDADNFYKSMLIGVWSECFRVMRDGATLAFTFHHSEDSQWVLVLESLFESGLVLTGTYPITSDESKGENAEFGSKRIEYVILHVCRKRLEGTKAVSWPKLRQWVKGEFSRLRPLLESYKLRGLSDADIRVILRGKALEFYSRHYGKVLVSAPGGEDTVLSIRDALLGINQLLDESSVQVGERPPSIVHPVVYQYLRLFGPKATYSRDEVSKLLRGTAIQQRDFERTGYESGKKVKKTQNFRLAEALWEHSRDMLLLSATPHQGDHFRFWMLIRLLDPRLFENTTDMVDNRHRLNAVVFRRTQADACNADGEPLFSRRQVHTSAFHLTEAEMTFYKALMDCGGNQFTYDGNGCAGVRPVAEQVSTFERFIKDGIGERLRHIGFGWNQFVPDFRHEHRCELPALLHASHHFRPNRFTLG